jgi:hypothetical protein
MEELETFFRDEPRLRDAGLIAISLIILQVWISSGTHDVPSLISLIAFAVSIPMLSFDLLLRKAPYLVISGKTMTIIADMNKFIGIIGAIIGIVAALWHVTWVAGLIFLIIGIISCSIYFIVSSDSKDLLKRAYGEGWKEGEKRGADRALEDFLYFD